ncbi:MAG: amidohydrolase family protein [Acidobacteriota bacterium]
MNRKLLGLLSIPVVGFLFGCTPAEISEPDPSAPLFIEGATLIDVTGGPALANSSVLIEGSRITQIGSSDEISPPPGARILDAQGKFIIPGLVDMHVHYGRTWIHRLYLANGVTTVRDLGGSVERLNTLRQEIEVGNILAPRMFISGVPINPRSVKASGETSAWDMASQMIKGGVDGIKVTGYSIEELRKIIEVAHAADLWVYGHTGPTTGNVGPGARAAVEAGLDGIEHGTSLLEDSLEGEIPLPSDYDPSNWDHMFRHWYGPMNQWVSTTKLDALTQLMADQEVYFSPTLVTMQRNFEFAGTPAVDADPNRKYMVETGPARFGTFTDQERQEWTKNLDLMKRATKTFQEAGGVLLVGTDSPGAVFPGWGLHQELELFVEAGLTEMEALQTATINAAKVLGKEDVLGALEAGKYADLLILDADPLENIQNTQRIHRVISNGRLLDPAVLLKDNLEQFARTSE